MILTNVLDLLGGEISLFGSGPNLNSNCGCLEKVVLQKDSRAIFDNLKHDDYFPMIARTHSQAFYGLPPKALRIINPGLSTGNSGSDTTTSIPRKSHNHARYITDFEDVGSDISFGETILDDAIMDMDMDSARHQSIQSSLTGVDLLELRSNEQISSFSKAQRHHPLRPEVGALPENHNCAEKQLQMSRSEDETRYQRSDWLTEVLAEKDKMIHDAKVTIEQLEIQDQDANGSIEDLRIKIQQLREENSRLATDRDQAQDDFGTALSLAHNAFVRYKHSATSSKRDWAQVEYSSGSQDLSTKNPKLADFT